MNRRQLLKSGLSAASLLSFWPLKGLANLSLADEMASLGPVWTDNDGDPMSRGGRADFAGNTLGMRTISRSLKFLSFEQVSLYISPILEASFDMFFLTNTDTKSNEGDLVAHQHILVIRRTKPGTALFTRDENDRIIGLSEDAEVWDPIPTSTGAPGNGSILTYSGVFRFNHIRSKNKIGTNESPNAPMSYSMYIDYVYNNGAESGVAIHGTPSGNYRLLGKSRASHGCMRVRHEKAKEIRKLLLSSDMWSEVLPEFDRRAQFPNANVMGGQVRVRAGIKALCVIFNGYSNRLIDT